MSILKALPRDTHNFTKKTRTSTIVYIYLLRLHSIIDNYSVRKLRKDISNTIYESLPIPLLGRGEDLDQLVLDAAVISDDAGNSTTRKH